MDFIQTIAAGLIVQAGGSVFDIGKQYLLRCLGLAPSPSAPSAMKPLLDDYFQQLKGRLDEDRIAELRGAFSLLEEASRAPGKRGRPTNALATFHKISHIPQQGITGGNPNAQLRCLAFLGIAASYMISEDQDQKDDQDQLIAKNWVKAVQADAATAEQLLGRDVVREILARLPDGYRLNSGQKLLGTVLCTYVDHVGPVNALAWSPDGRRIASGSSDKTVRIWDANTGQTIITYHGHAKTVNTLAWSPDGRRIASGSDDYQIWAWNANTIQTKTVQIWDANTGQTIVTCRGQAMPVKALAWSPDGRRIASGSSDKTVRIWDANTGQTIVTYRGHSSVTSTSVNALAWSPDGRRIASGNNLPPVHVWNATTGQKLLICVVHAGFGGGSVNALAWSPDGRRIASGSSDKTVRIWDATMSQNRTGQIGEWLWVPTTSQKLTYRGHASRVNALAWSPDGGRIASGSSDRTVQVWNANTGQLIYTYRGGPVNALAWSPDGERIASGSSAHTVQVWQAS